MSEADAGGGMTINWRGPLLAAAIFAAVFLILLIMARQNESNTSDMGSSLRQDPYGTSLLFDSYERAGYQVERSPDEDSLSEQAAPHTTAFFIGGYPNEGWETVNGTLRSKGKFSGRLQDSLARGGRVVLVAPVWELKSSVQGWDVKDQWYQTPHKLIPTWATPAPGIMPAGSEKMYLAADAPWLKTDTHWTALYKGPVNPDEKRDWSAHTYMAMRRTGKGELVAASQEWFLLNETVKTHPNPVLLDFLAGGRPAIWVDESIHGLYQDEGVLWLVRRYRLQATLLFFWAALLGLLWSLSGDLVRRPARDWSKEIVRNGERAGVAGQRLLQRSVPREQVVAECWEQFRRRSPEDAKAISADPRWGPRLRAALALAPLAGYRELTMLIAERRESAIGLARPAETDRTGWDNISTSPKASSEEARIA